MRFLILLLVVRGSISASPNPCVLLIPQILTGSFMGTYGAVSGGGGLSLSTLTNGQLASLTNGQLTAMTN